MAYIGKSIESGTFSVLDTSGNTYNGSNVTFSLGTQVGSPAQLLVSHDGVIQKPGTDYSLATGGTQITFSTAPASGASIFIVEISGAVGGPLDSDLNGTELILDADADTSITADTDDQIDIKIAGADDFTITANKFDALAGSNIHVSGDADADDITGDSAQGRVTLGAGQDLNLYHGGTNSYIVNDTGNLVINTGTSDSDIVFSGNDGGSAITALTLDMSADGHATFKNGVTLTDGNVTVASGHGIDFSATGDGDGTDSSELLEDYEEGTWTPTFFDAESGGNQLSTSSSTGVYVKVGNLIRINSRSTINSISGATGGNAVRMRGLPYATFNNAGHDAVGKAEIFNTGTAIDSEMTGLPSDAGAVANFKNRAAAGTARPASITVTVLGASATIISSLTYRTA
jgi:hypothetical protein